MAGSSGACISPSTVQSTTRVLPASAAMTGASCCKAVDAPVDRTTGPPVSKTVGSSMRKAGQPSRAAA